MCVCICVHINIYTVFRHTYIHIHMYSYFHVYIYAYREASITPISSSVFDEVYDTVALFLYYMLGMWTHNIGNQLVPHIPYSSTFQQALYCLRDASQRRMGPLNALSHIPQLQYKYLQAQNKKLGHLQEGHFCSAFSAPNLFSEFGILTFALSLVLIPIRLLSLS